jgi:hypothetical protein
MTEAIAAKMLRFVYIRSEENASDILTKPLCNDKFHYLMTKTLKKKLLFVQIIQS